MDEMLGKSLDLKGADPRLARKERRAERARSRGGDDDGAIDGVVVADRGDFAQLPRPDVGDATPCMSISKPASADRAGKAAGDTPWRVTDAKTKRMITQEAAQKHRHSSNSDLDYGRWRRFLDSLWQSKSRVGASTRKREKARDDDGGSDPDECDSHSVVAADMRRHARLETERKLPMSNMRRLFNQQTDSSEAGKAVRLSSKPENPEAEVPQAVGEPDRSDSDLDSSPPPRYYPPYYVSQRKRPGRSWGFSRRRDPVANGSSRNNYSASRSGLKSASGSSVGTQVSDETEDPFRQNLVALRTLLAEHEWLVNSKLIKPAIVYALPGQRNQRIYQRTEGTSYKNLVKLFREKVDRYIASEPAARADGECLICDRGILLRQGVVE